MRAMQRMIQTLGYLVPLFAAVALVFLFNLTDPLSVGPGGILMVFLLVYIFWAGLFFTVLHLGLGLASRMLIKYRRTVTVRSLQMGVRKAYYIASALAFAPVLFLAMNSVGQLQLRDVGLVLVFMTLIIFYIVKRT